MGIAGRGLRAAGGRAADTWGMLSLLYIAGLLVVRPMPAFFAVGGVPGGVEVTGGAGVVAADPVVVFEQTFYHAGVVSDDQPLKHAFRFTNVSNRVVRLSVGRCHFCPPGETDKPEYKPGESGFVLLELTTMGRFGEVQGDARVTVSGGSGKEEPIELKIAADVRPPVYIQPSPLVLGEVVQAQGLSEPVVLTGHMLGFKLGEVTSDSDWLAAEVGPAQVKTDKGDPYTEHVLTVRVKPGVPRGEFTGKLSATTNDPSRPSVQLTVRANVVGDLVAEPLAVGIGARRPRETFVGTFDLGTRSGRPLFFGSVKLDAVAVKGVTNLVVDAVPGKDLGTLHVTVTGTTPPMMTAPFEQMIRVTVEGSDGAVQDELAVPVRLSVRRTGAAGR